MGGRAAGAAGEDGGRLALTGFVAASSVRSGRGGSGWAESRADQGRGTIMNRRVAFGCLGVAALVLIIAGLFFYLNVFRPTRAVMGDLHQIGELNRMNAGITDQASFIPPEDGQLTEDQVRRFVAVQDTMIAALGSAYDSLGVKADRFLALKRANADSTRKVGFADVMRIFKGLGPLMSRAKEAQVRGLNAEDFSLGEYRWVRETVYHALGRTQVTLYLEDFARNFDQAGRIMAPEETGGPAPAVTTQDRELVQPYASQSEAWKPFLVLGL